MRKTEHIGNTRSSHILRIRARALVGVHAIQGQIGVRETIDGRWRWRRYLQLRTVNVGVLGGGDVARLCRKGYREFLIKFHLQHLTSLG